MGARWVDLVDPTREELLAALPSASIPRSSRRCRRAPRTGREPRPLLESHGAYVFGVLLAARPPRTRTASCTARSTSSRRRSSSSPCASRRATAGAIRAVGARGRASRSPARASSSIGSSTTSPSRSSSRRRRRTPRSRSSRSTSTTGRRARPRAARRSAPRASPQPANRRGDARRGAPRTRQAARRRQRRALPPAVERLFADTYETLVRATEELDIARDLLAASVTTISRGRRGPERRRQEAHRDRVARARPELIVGLLRPELRVGVRRRASGRSASPAGSSSRRRSFSSRSIAGAAGSERGLDRAARPRPRRTGSRGARVRSPSGSRASTRRGTSPPAGRSTCSSARRRASTTTSRSAYPPIAFPEIARRSAELELVVVGDGQRVADDHVALAAHRQTWAREPTRALATRRHARALGRRHLDLPARPARSALPGCRARRPHGRRIPYEQPEVALLFKAKAHTAEGRARLRRRSSRTSTSATRLAPRRAGRSCTPAIAGSTALATLATKAARRAEILEHALLAERPARVADAAAVPDQEVREAGPVRPRHDPLEVALDLHRVFLARQPEPLREPPDVRVDHDALRVAELGGDDVRGLSRDAGQPDQLRRVAAEPRRRTPR